jgi:hypothetical protein
MKLENDEQYRSKMQEGLDARKKGECVQALQLYEEAQAVYDRKEVRSMLAQVRGCIALNAQAFFNGASWPLPMRMTREQVAHIAAEAGFAGESLAQAIALSYAESSWVANLGSGPNKDKYGSYDYGLWQMNNTRANLFFDFGQGPQTEVNPDVANCDPACNAAYTYTLWKYGGPNKKGPPCAFNSTKWHAYGGKEYQKELPRARKFLMSDPTYREGFSDSTKAPNDCR